MSTNGSTNGRARLDDGKVRVALIGVGNCANSLLQGREYYKDAPDDQFVPGLMHVNLGGYHIRDIEFTAAFDVVQGKVGEDLADAIWAHPNDTIKFADVPKSGITVSRGMTHDGLGKYISQVVEKAPGETADIVKILKETKTDVVVITAGLVLAPWGGLQWAIYLLAATSWLTVVQRILHVRKQLVEGEPNVHE